MQLEIYEKKGLLETNKNGQNRQHSMDKESKRRRLTQQIEMEIYS